MNYYENIDLTRKRVWHVQLVIPKEHREDAEKRWNLNTRVTVAAETLEKAMAALRKRYPHAVFYGVNHGGLFEVTE